MILFGLGLLSTQLYGQNCEMNAGASQNTIHCGECVTLSAFGQNTALSVLNEDFNSGGFGPGWSSTPGAVNFSNPCSGGGVDGTPHAWMDDNTSQPRDLVSAPYDFSTATAGVSICFDLLYAIQGNAAPCEGPDEPDEGVYLEYSIDGGSTWVTINYFDPLGGNDPQLTNWNNYCFDLPPAAVTSNTLIRWHQDVGSGADYDHWGIDNVQIFMNDVTSQIEWIADASVGFPSYVYPVGSGGGDNPTPVCPTTTTTYTAQITTSNGDVCTATTTIVVNPIQQINVTASANPTTICTSNGECADITATAEVILEPAGPKTFENIQPFSFSNGLFGSGNETVNVNVQGLNMPNVNPGSIQSVCIDFLDFHPSVGEQDGINDLEVSLMCPSGTEIILVAMNTGPEGINGGWFGTDQPSYYQNVCFVPVAAQYVSDIPNASAAALPVTGNYMPADPLTGLDGCTSNGVWEIHLDNNNVWGGSGTLTGWSITFMDDPMLGTPNFTWSPSAPLSDPNSLTPQVCTPGTYTISVDNGSVGCGTQSASVTIIGASGGDASFTTTDFCEGQTNSATITGDAGGTFAFNPVPSDGATINSSTGEISNGIGGTTYSIEYTTPGGCSSSSIQNVTVNPIFNTTENIIICSGSDYTYPDGTIHNNITADESYASNLSSIYGCDSIITTNITVTLTTVTENINICSGANYTYPDGTTHTNISVNESYVSNLVSVAGCDSVVTTNVIVNPVFSINENFSICSGSNHTFPDGTVHSNIIVDESYVSNLLTVNGCDSIITTNVIVNPVYNLSENISICTGGNYTYPDGTIHNNIIADESYVSNLLSVDGCDSIVTTNITVINGFNITENIIICENDQYTYPDGTNVTITADESHVSNLVSVQGCDSIITTNITMAPLYNINESYSICSGSNYTFPDGTIHNNILNNETYISNLQSINGCDSVITTNITVNPIFNNNESASICSGEDYTYPDGTTHTNLTADEVYISNFLTVNGCDSIITTTVTVNPLPNVDAGSTQEVCDGTTITLNGSGASNYVWDNGAQDGVAFVPPIGTTTYTVTGTDANGCVNTDQVTVTNHPMPVVDFTLDSTSGCLPLTVNFTDNTTPSGINCVWDFGNGTTANICGNTSYTYTQTGNYDVTYTVTYAGNCTSSQTYSSVLVEDVPQAIFSVNNSQLTIENTEVEFENNSINSNTYQWDFGDNSSGSSITDPTHIFPETGNSVYIVTLVASNDAGCTDTTQQTIHVDDVIIYYVPNAFTPDGDAFNQTFQPVFTSGYDPYEYHLVIFNRWGEIIFESYNASIGWNGTYPKDGELVEDGIYVWKINFKETMSDKKHEAVGHVTVLR